MIKNYVITILAVIAIILFSLRACEPVPVTNKQHAIHDTITVTKEKIKTEKQEVIKWKQAKEKIRYVTQFDTIATIDTVKIELIKCDQVVKIDSVIINRLDSIVAHQDKLISLKDIELKENKKALRKGKRKAFFAGLGIGYMAGLLTPL